MFLKDRLSLQSSNRKENSGKRPFLAGSAFEDLVEQIDYDGHV